MGAGSGCADLMGFLRQIWMTLAVLVVGFVASWGYFMPNADQRGVWRSETGGTLLTLSPFTAQLYSETALSCQHQLSFPAHLKLVEWAEGATVTTEGDRLLFQVDGALDPMVLRRIDALPDNCTDETDATPRAVFDVMWTAMNDHYAFFDLHGVDWQARRALAPAPDANMPDQALFALLSEALIGLDDPNIQLATQLGYFTPATPPAWQTEALTRAQLNQIARDTIGTPLTPLEMTGIEYTLLPDGTGYVLLRHLGINTPFAAKSGPAMARAFAQAADALADADTIILDLRTTPGGANTAAFGVAGHFTDQILPVFTKTTRQGQGQTAPFEAALAPYDDTPLTQPVIVLTSGLTSAAAEILTLALRDMPQVTLMGGPTAGALSDVMGVKLPNGWEVSLANQTYRATDGATYEGVGIPPDQPFIIETAPLLAGQDPMLEAALAQARGN